MAQKRKQTKKKRNAWFVPVRGSYLPASSAGWWTYVPFVTYLVAAFIFGLVVINSTVLKVLFIVITWYAGAVFMTYLASKKS